MSNLLVHHNVVPLIIGVYWLNFASYEAYVFHPPLNMVLHPTPPLNKVLHPLQALSLVRCKKWPVDGATDLFV